jgi:2-amino-4-hydroxy-6-hydroxymethyldihydropteridine diphosphokinase
MILVALGANLPGPAGGPRAQLQAALVELDRMGVRVRRVSRFWRTPAWPDPWEPAFVNAVAEVESALAPAALLAVLHAIEARLGRRRGRANAPRPIDLDLIDHHGLVTRDGSVPVLPHPRLAERAFVLLPLADVAPGWRHPVSGLGIRELVAALPPDAKAEPLEEAGAG